MTFLTLFEAKGVVQNPPYCKSAVIPPKWAPDNPKFRGLSEKLKKFLGQNMTFYSGAIALIWP